LSRSDSPLYVALLVAAMYAVFAYVLLQFRRRHLRVRGRGWTERRREDAA
jgi:hypothetical protein